MTLKEELTQLKEVEQPTRSVLSLYLNTDPTDPEQSNEAWKIHLKNGLKRLHEYVEAFDEPGEMKEFEKTCSKVQKEIEGNQLELHKGIIIFASESGDLWSVHNVQVPIKTSFHWEKKPILEPLMKMQDKYPSAGIILPSLDEVRIIDTSMGVIQDELYYEFDSDSDEWKNKKGLAYGAIRSSGATHIDAFDKRMKENLLRFYKDIGTTINQLKKKKNWAEIHLVGEADSTNPFAQVLNHKPDSVLNKNLINRNPNFIYDEVFK